MFYNIGPRDKARSGKGCNWTMREDVEDLFEPGNYRFGVPQLNWYFISFSGGLSYKTFYRRNLRIFVIS
jgi:hypothetical protein